MISQDLYASGPQGLESGEYYLAEALQANPVTVPEFGDQLEMVGNRLDAAGLGHVKPFVEVYLTMTRSVKGALAQDQFENPVELAALTCNFGKWFFDALRGRIEGERVPPAWDYLFEHSDRRLDAELALQGVIAHIVNDLPQSVRDTGMSPASKGDYFLVDQNIAYATASLTGRFVPGLRPVRRGVTMLGTRWATDLRQGAWRNYLKLDEADASDEPKERLALAQATIEDEALRSARSLGRVGSVAVGAAAFLQAMPRPPLVGRLLPR
jgi:hypothetical protein